MLIGRTFGFFCHFLLSVYNLFVTSKKRNHEFTNSKCCKRPESLLKPFLMVYYFLFITLKTFKPCFFILKALNDILQHFRFLNWWIGGFVFLMSGTGYSSDVSTNLSHQFFPRIFLSLSNWKRNHNKYLFKKFVYLEFEIGEKYFS